MKCWMNLGIDCGLSMRYRQMLQISQDICRVVLNGWVGLVVSPESLSYIG
jgi:hypothetical protein